MQWFVLLSSRWAGDDPGGLVLCAGSWASCRAAGSTTPLDTSSGASGAPRWFARCTKPPATVS